MLLLVSCFSTTYTIAGELGRLVKLPKKEISGFLFWHITRAADMYSIHPQSTILQTLPPNFSLHSTTFSQSQTEKGGSLLPRVYKHLVTAVTNLKSENLMFQC